MSFQMVTKMYYKIMSSYFVQISSYILYNGMWEIAMIFEFGLNIFEYR